MKLLAKFSLIYIAVFGLGLVATGIICYSLFQQNAREQVLNQAHLMMDSALAMRTYTTTQIKAAFPSRPDDTVFHPQTVPAFAATEIFANLRGKYPDYSYKEATLNPTNLRDRAADWEADIIRQFREHPETRDKPFSGERLTPAGKSVYLASPLAAAKGCLECHSTPDKAPAAMVKLYGPSNGFGWQEDEIIGAQIVSVPVWVPEAVAARSFRQLMISLAIVGAVTLIVLNIVLALTVVRPVRRFAETADRISRGDMEGPELPATGKDEISILAASFNRMHRSLAAAMKMLEGK